ncbi:MAG: PEP_CTERM-anchored TLD domain-containing protein [Bryobacteraceae bacterium]
MLCLSLPLGAATTWTGGVLLDQAGADQLAAWLGEGDLVLTNVFSSGPVANGSTAFHAASDNLGRTFVLIETDLGLVGGYDPQSWGGFYNITIPDAERTAFIFNLSTAVKEAQVLGPSNSNAGQYQTVNGNAYGPVFGLGYDLGVADGSLTSGDALTYSYGAGYNTPNIFGVAFTRTQFSVVRIETYTISDVATPEPATFGLCGLALAIGAALTRKRSKQQAMPK